MKKILLFLIVLFLATSTTAEAHVLQSDSTVGAVMHIDPNDEPIAGEQSNFFFEFKDKTNRFKPENCQCSVKILEGGKEIFSTNPFQANRNPNLSNASFSYVFPQKDIYQIKVEGKPIKQSDFEEFTLTYDIRVDKIATNTTTPSEKSWLSTHVIHIVGISIIVLFFLASLAKQMLKKNRTNTHG